MIFLKKNPCGEKARRPVCSNQANHFVWINCMLYMSAIKGSATFTYKLNIFYDIYQTNH
jgi:hypothetical protein